MANAFIFLSVFFSGRMETSTWRCYSWRDNRFQWETTAWHRNDDTLAVAAKAKMMAVAPCIYVSSLLLSAPNLTLTHIKFIFCAQLLNLFIPSWCFSVEKGLEIDARNRKYINTRARLHIQWQRRLYDKIYRDDDEAWWKITCNLMITCAPCPSRNFEAFEMCP